MIDFTDLASHLFGGHVTDGPHYGSGNRRLGHDRRGYVFTGGATAQTKWPLWFDKFCEAEVENLCEAIGRDHNVRRFQIAVHDAGGVCFCKSLGDLLKIA